MTTISFKADEKFKKRIEIAAQEKGINTSAYIKLILTKEVNSDLSRITENGYTVAQELEILKAVKSSKKIGPFNTVGDLFKSLKK